MWRTVTSSNAVITKTHRARIRVGFMERLEELHAGHHRHHQIEKDDGVLRGRVSVSASAPLIAA